MPPQDRLPPIPDEAQTPAQRTVAQELVSGPRGRLVGPFVPLMRSPELMRRVQKVGEYLRFDSRLSDRIKELAILVVARHWSQPFEWAFHLPLALKAGLARSICEDIASGAWPTGMAPDEEAAYALVRELLETRQVGDGVWADAAAAFGEEGLVDLIGFAGYYALLAMTMNAARTPAPGAEIPLTDSASL